MSEHPYPPAPWQMHGSMWMSVFKLRADAHVDSGATRPAGTYAVGFVSYVDPSPLSYSELLAARYLADGPRKGFVSITDIWVDSPASMAGGRELWAIPKHLCDFDLESSFRGPVTSTSWQASIERAPIVEASFTDVSRLAPRVPMKGKVWQPGIDDHPDDADIVMAGTARVLPCRSRWHFASDGPLGFLSGARKVGSFRSKDFRLSFD